MNRRVPTDLIRHAPVIEMVTVTQAAETEASPQAPPPRLPPASSHDGKSADELRREATQELRAMASVVATHTLATHRRLVHERTVNEALRADIALLEQAAEAAMSSMAPEDLQATRARLQALQDTLAVRAAARR